MTVNISISDLQTFLQCRQRWNYSSTNRRSLRHKATPRPYLTVGSAIHAGIEAQINGEEPLAATLTYVDEEREKKVAAYEEATGHKPWDMEMVSFEENAELATNLMGQYFRHYGTLNPLADVDLEYIAAEVSFKIPLPDFDDPALTGAYFVGTFDGVAQDPRTSEIWLVENKTYSQLGDIEELGFNFQSTGYMVAFEWLTGIKPAGVLYNGIAKKLIKYPTVLKNGTLSVAKDQLVTLQSYLDGMRMNDADPFDPRYQAYLTLLEQRERQGDRRFFFREKLYFPDELLDAWREDFKNVSREMYGYLDDSHFPVIYRTIPFNGCGPKGNDCWYRDLCHTEKTGGDVDYVLESYKTGSYGTMEAVESVTPVLVSSVEDLIRTLRK